VNSVFFRVANECEHSGPGCTKLLINCAIEIELNACK